MTSSARPDLRDQLQDALGDAYQIDRELPPGGMSRLFLATERSLDRKVVIKLLPPEYASEVSAARFQREITLTANLQHPHILPILSAGSRNGLLYYVTPYVEGESLRHRLQREGKLPVAAASQILREIADALARAHRAGIVHRDIKPENILLADEHALLADFGVARALHESTGAQALTATGTGLGTPGYMAPEQLAGERAIDSRADLYALAVVGYEMLAGAPPFTGPTAQAIAAAHFTGAPKPVRQLRPEVPPEMSAALTKGLATDPAQRFDTAREFRDALGGDGVPSADHRRPRPSVIAGLAGAVIVAIIALTLTWGGRIAHAATPPRLAVLPFESVGDTSGREFADGMSEEITTRLAHVSGMSIVGRSSVLQYRTSHQAAPDFGRRLGVDYVLDGTVRWAPGPNGAKAVRITPALIRVRDGTEVWGEPYEGVAANVFQLQSDVAEHVATALRVTLLPGERASIRTIPTQDVEAHRLYLKGREEWRKRTPVALANAVTDFQQAIARDSNYAQAYMGLADVYSVARYWDAFPSTPRDTLYARGKAAARRALNLDSTLADAHSAMAELLCYGDWDWDGAAREARRAIALDSNNATAHQRYAEILAFTGHPQDALPEARRAFRLDPLAPAVASVYAEVFEMAGQRDSAIAAWREMLGHDSASGLIGVNNLTFEYIEVGQRDEATSMLRQRGDTAGFQWDLVHATSDTAAKRRVLIEVAQQHAAEQIRTFLDLGMRDSAFAALARAVPEHDERLERLGAFPVYAAMRGDPRYTAALRAIHLAP